MRRACRNCEGGTPRGVATMLIAFARVRYVANGSKAPFGKPASYFRSTADNRTILERDRTSHPGTIADNGVGRGACPISCLRYQELSKSETHPDRGIDVAVLEEAEAQPAMHLVEHHAKIEIPLWRKSPIHCDRNRIIRPGALRMRAVGAEEEPSSWGCRTREFWM